MSIRKNWALTAHGDLDLPGSRRFRRREDAVAEAASRNRGRTALGLEPAWEAIRVRPELPPFIEWGRKLGNAECPYVRRWKLEIPRAGSVRVHHWTGPDDDRAFHDHPWWFLTLVIKGAYDDHSPGGIDCLHAGSVRFRGAEYKHYVIPSPEAWTILITGPKIRAWGFWKDGKFRKANKWFASRGHHPCS